jgi:hypothetical protein
VDFDPIRDEVPPYSCGNVEERINLGSLEHTIICGAYAPEVVCHSNECGLPICDKHVRFCEECEDEHHEDCMQIVNNKLVCKKCSLTMADCLSFGSPVAALEAA